MARPRRVLAIGWLGAGNLGDEVMLEGLRRWLGRALGPLELTVTSSDPDATRAAHGAAAIRLRPPQASGFRDWDLVRASWRADLVTLGGGDLIREQADGTIPALNWLARMRVPFRLRRRTALVGVSVGELFTPRVIEAVAPQLRRFSLLAARDTESARALAELTGRHASVMGDLALEASGPVPLLEAGRVPRIAVTTREIVGRGPSVSHDAGARLETELAIALDRVAATTGARVELIPLRPHVGSRRRDDDERAGESLAARAATGEAWIRREPPRNAQAFAQLMAKVDMVVSVRLHGAVLAAGSGRRVVGIAYDPKVSGFFRDLGLPGQGLPLDADARSIGDVILASLEDASLEERITRGVATLRERTRALDAKLRALVSSGDPVAEG